MIRGYQPAQVSLWKFVNDKASFVKVLSEKAHRNSIKWNPFGSVVLVAGFGNLAGDMDFYARVNAGKPEDGCDILRIGNATASCTVSVEWASDGMHVITAVLAPRMRVDNGFTMWNCLQAQPHYLDEFERLIKTKPLRSWSTD